VDGCSAPTFSLPIYNMALGFARLARAAADPGPVARLLRAMAGHPAHTGEPDMRGFALRGGAAPFPAAFVTKLGANGVPLQFTIHVKGANGSDGVLAGNNPNTWLMSNGKGVDHFFDVYGAGIGLSFATCGVPFLP